MNEGIIKHINMYATKFRYYYNCPIWKRIFNRLYHIDRQLFSVQKNWTLYKESLNDAILFLWKNLLDNRYSESDINMLFELGLNEIISATDFIIGAPFCDIDVVLRRIRKQKLV